MKKEEVGRLTEQRALDTLTEKIESFEIEGNDKEQITLYLYPLQLGRLAMISRRLIDLDLIFDDEQMEGAVKRMWTICSEKSKEVAEIIAIATLRTQQEIEDMLKERTKLIYWSPTMDTTALTNILSTIVFQSYYADFMNAIRLVRTLRVMISPTTTAERIATTEGAVSGLAFQRRKKYVETFDEEKKGTKHLITALTDIYKLSDQLISTVKFYLK